jgi:hypothetical protein
MSHFLSNFIILVIGKLMQRYQDLLKNARPTDAEHLAFLEWIRMQFLDKDWRHYYGGFLLFFITNILEFFRISKPYRGLVRQHNFQPVV